MLKIRCKNCNTELISHPTRTRCCGCENMTMVKGDTITAVDLSKIVMLNSTKENKKSTVLTSQDLQFQEDRKNRKVSKNLLDSVDIR